MLFEPSSIDNPTFTLISPGSGNPESALRATNPPLIALASKVTKLTSPKHSQKVKLPLALLSKQPLSDLPAVNHSEQQEDIESKTLEFEEDPVAYFSKRKDGRGHRFIYLVHAQNKQDPDFNPYELKKVTHKEIIKHRSYFTMSATGVTYVDSEGNTEHITLDKWAREESIYKSVRKLKLFKNYLLWKPLRNWRNFIKKTKFEQTQTVIVNKPMYYNLSMASACVALASLLEGLETTVSKNLLVITTHYKQSLNDFIQTTEIHHEQLKTEFAQFISDTAELLLELHRMLADEALLDVSDREFAEIRRKNPNIRHLIVLERKKENEKLRRGEQMECELEEFVSLVRMVDYIILETVRKAAFNAFRQAAEAATADQSAVMKVEIRIGQSVTINPNREQSMKEIEKVLQKAKSLLYGLPRVIRVQQIRDILLKICDFPSILEGGPTMQAIVECEPVIQKSSALILSALDESYTRAEKAASAFDYFLPLVALSEKWDPRDFITDEMGNPYTGPLSMAERTAESDTAFLTDLTNPQLSIDSLEELLKMLDENSVRASKAISSSVCGFLAVDSRSTRDRMIAIPSKLRTDVLAMTADTRTLKTLLIERCLKGFSSRLRVDPQGLADYSALCEEVAKAERLEPIIISEAASVGYIGELLTKCGVLPERDFLKDLIEQFQAAKRSANTVVQNGKEHFLALLGQAERRLARKVSKVKCDAEAIPSGTALDSESVLARVSRMRAELTSLEPAVRELEAFRSAISPGSGVGVVEFEETRQAVSLAERVRKISSYLSSINSQMDLSFAHVSISELSRDVSALREEIKLADGGYSAIKDAENLLSQLEPAMPSLETLSAAHLQSRHWDELLNRQNASSKSTASLKSVKHSDKVVTLRLLLSNQDYLEQERVKAISKKARGEAMAEGEWAAVRAHWTEAKVEPGALSSLIADAAATAVSLDNLVASPFAGSVAAAAQDLRKELAEAIEILKKWEFLRHSLESLKPLMHLLPANDAVTQLESLDEALADNPRVLAVTSIHTVKETIGLIGVSVESLQRGLATLIDSKREILPRLCAASDSDVCLLLSARDASSLSKAFTRLTRGNARLDAHSPEGSAGRVFAIVGSDGEPLPLLEPVVFDAEPEVAFASILRAGESAFTSSLTSSLARDAPPAEWLLAAPAHVAAAALAICLTRETPREQSRRISAIAAAVSNARGHERERLSAFLSMAMEHAAGGSANFKFDGGLVIESNGVQWRFGGEFWGTVPPGYMSKSAAQIIGGARLIGEGSGMSSRAAACAVGIYLAEVPHTGDISPIISSRLIKAATLASFGVNFSSPEGIEWGDGITEGGPGKGFVTINYEKGKWETIPPFIRASVRPVAIASPVKRPMRISLDDDKPGDSEVMLKLRKAFREHRAIAICGPPGSGKTTLLDTYAKRTPGERPLSIETLYPLSSEWKDMFGGDDDGFFRGGLLQAAFNALRERHSTHDIVLRLDCQPNESLLKFFKGCVGDGDSFTLPSLDSVSSDGMTVVFECETAPEGCEDWLGIVHMENINSEREKGNHIIFVGEELSGKTSSIQEIIEKSSEDSVMQFDVTPMTSPNEITQLIETKISNFDNNLILCLRHFERASNILIEFIRMLVSNNNYPYYSKYDTNVYGTIKVPEISVLVSTNNISNLSNRFTSLFRIVETSRDPIVSIKAAVSSNGLPSCLIQLWKKINKSIFLAIFETLQSMKSYSLTDKSCFLYSNLKYVVHMQEDELNSLLPGCTEVFLSQEGVQDIPHDLPEAVKTIVVSLSNLNVGIKIETDGDLSNMLLQTSQVTKRDFLSFNPLSYYSSPHRIISLVLPAEQVELPLAQMIPSYSRIAYRNLFDSLREDLESESSERISKMSASIRLLEDLRNIRDSASKQLDELTPELNKLNEESSTKLAALHMKQDAVHTRRYKLTEESLRMKKALDEMEYDYKAEEDALEAMKPILENAREAVLCITEHDLKPLRVSLSLTASVVMQAAAVATDKSIEELLNRPDMGSILAGIDLVRLDYESIQQILSEPVPAVDVPAITDTRAFLDAACRYASQSQNVRSLRANLEIERRKLADHTTRVSGELEAVDDVEATLEADTAGLRKLVNERDELDKKCLSLSQNVTRADRILEGLDIASWSDCVRPEPAAGDALMIAFFVEYAVGLTKTEREKQITKAINLLSSDTTFKTPLSVEAAVMRRAASSSLEQAASLLATRPIIIIDPQGLFPNEGVIPDAEKDEEAVEDTINRRFGKPGIIFTAAAEVSSLLTRRTTVIRVDSPNKVSSKEVRLAKIEMALLTELSVTTTDILNDEEGCAKLAELKNQFIAERDASSDTEESESNVGGKWETVWNSLPESRRPIRADFVAAAETDNVYPLIPLDVVTAIQLSYKLGKQDADELLRQCRSFTPDMAIPESAGAVTVILCGNNGDAMHLLSSYAISRGREDALSRISLHGSPQRVMDLIDRAMRRGDWAIVEYSMPDKVAASTLNDFITGFPNPRASSSFRLIVCLHSIEHISTRVFQNCRKIAVDSFPSPAIMTATIYTHFANVSKPPASLKRGRRLLHSLSLMFTQIRLRSLIKPAGFSEFPNIEMPLMHRCFEHIKTFESMSALRQNIVETLVSVSPERQDRRRLRAIVAAALPDTLFDDSTEPAGCGHFADTTMQASLVSIRSSPVLGNSIAALYTAPAAEALYINRLEHLFAREDGKTTVRIIVDKDDHLLPVFTDERPVTPTGDLTSDYSEVLREIESLIKSKSIEIDVPAGNIDLEFTFANPGEEGLVISELYALHLTEDSGVLTIPDPSETRPFLPFPALLVKAIPTNQRKTQKRAVIPLYTRPGGEAIAEVRLPADRGDRTWLLNASSLYLSVSAEDLSICLPGT